MSKSVAGASPSSLFQSGQVIEFPYPFILEEVELLDEEYASYKTKSWRPGVRCESVYPDDTKFVADGLGKQIVKVVSIHKPGRFPERIFYTRQWLAPNGKSFGKPKLRMTTTAMLKRLVRGYGYEYELVGSSDAAA